MTIRQHNEIDNTDNNGDNFMQEVEYGISQSQMNTSWVYRDSSSLMPAQRLEQEVYYHTAKDILQLFWEKFGNTAMD